MVVSSDNGGPTYYIPNIGYGGASNQPLKGGKMSDWEGGVGLEDSFNADEP